MMDTTLFVIGRESRLRILEQAAARVPGCAYLCVWAPIPGGQPPPPSSFSATAASAHLLCLDAWLCDGGRGDDRVRALFDAYRGSLCAVVSGCVPGWAYKDGRAYMELPENDLAASASLPEQQQFYQEAGIKMDKSWQMAAFMGCGSGEIEVGMSAAAAANGARMNLQASVEQVFSEDFFQQSLLEELLQLPPTRPSSSSSVESTADCPTSLLRTMAMSSATPSPRELTVSPLLHPRPPHPVPFSRHGHGHIHFPSAEADDAAMAQAMLAVISASSSSALPTPSNPPPGNHRSQRSPRRGSTTAFRAYNAALAPRAPQRPPGAHGQRMIKMGISILRRMHPIRSNRERTASAAAQRGQEEEEEAATAPPAPTSSQLHHMISERRRRERLNESFEVLRGLLPPGSKKDKATVLGKTLDYMNLLIAQISDLETKNRSLESQIHQRINGSSTSRTANEVQWLISGSPERVQVQVSSCAGASTSSSESRREVTIRVVARAECDLSELVVRVIALLKEMGRFTVVSVDARQPSSNNGTAQASLTLRATAGGLDEASLEEAVTKAVEGLVTPPPPDEP